METRKRESHDICVRLAYSAMAVTSSQRQPAATWQRTYSVKGMRTPKVSKKTGFGFVPFLKEKIEEKGRAVLS